MFVKEMKFIVKNLPTKKIPGLVSSIGEVYHTLKEEIMPFLQTLPENTKREDIPQLTCIRPALL